MGLLSVYSGAREETSSLNFAGQGMSPMRLYAEVSRFAVLQGDGFENNFAL